jgi:hypothetical protein
MTERHAPALDVSVDPILHPATPIGVGQGDALRVTQAYTVLGTQPFDVKDPAVAVPVLH